MQVVPDAVFIVDSHLERLAVDEARRMNATTVAITDTNADPLVIDYPIPANDDATGSVKLIVKHIIDAWIEGRQEGIKQEEKKAKKEEDAKSKEADKSKPTEASQKEKTGEIKKINLVLSEAPVEKKVKKPAGKVSKAVKKGRITK